MPRATRSLERDDSEEIEDADLEGYFDRLSTPRPKRAR
jgi:hypothetical protein